MTNLDAGAAARGFLPPWDGEALSAAFSSRRDRAWTIGYASLDQPSIESNSTWSGTYPHELRGTLFRNGPAKHERGGRRYGHRWDGDGMVQRFTLTEHGVAHFGRYVETTKYLAEEASGRMIYSGFGTAVDDQPPTLERMESSNPANINLVHFANEFLALWEAGAPYSVDPYTLGTIGRPSWLRELPRAPFSAHPRIAKDGSLWNFGVDPLDDELHLFHVGPNSKALRADRLPLSPAAPIHDFAITEHYLVFLLPSLTVNTARLLSGSSFAESCQWSPQLGMRVLLVDQITAAVTCNELPPGCLFHIANAWEADGEVIIDYMRAPDPSSLLAGWAVMRGEYRHLRGARLTRARIPLGGGTAIQAELADHDAEFPCISTGDNGRHYQNLLCVERSSGRDRGIPGFDQLAYRNVQSGACRTYNFGADWLVEEHVLVAPGDRSEPRWAIGTALDAAAGQTVLSVFELASLDRGPVAQARLPYALPLGLHGTFVTTVFE